MSTTPPAPPSADQAPVRARGTSPGGADEVLRRIWRSGWLWLTLFVVTRAIIYYIWAARYRFIANDVNYYYYWVMQPGLGWDRLQEYPLPVVWLLGLIAAPAPTQGDYMVLFGIAMAVLDGLFAWLLFKRGSIPALAFWIAFVTGYGALVWLRYDMVPALLVGLAALWVAKHPTRAGALVAAGASLKLWPAMLIAPLMGRGQAAKQRMIGFTVTGLLLALLALIAGGPARLVSPLTWQGDRGLQVESVPATWLMWLHSGTDGARWTVEMSKYNAYEIFGPDVAGWLKASTLMMALVVLSAVGMGIVVWWHKALPADVMILAMVAIVAGMLVANKTFSTQYLIWLATPVAALVSEARRPATKTIAAVLATCLVPLAWFTYRIYPVQYGGIVANPIGDRQDMTVLVVRNLMLLVVALIATVGAWVLLVRHGRRASATAAGSGAQATISSGRAVRTSSAAAQKQDLAEPPRGAVPKSPSPESPSPESPSPAQSPVSAAAPTTAASTAVQRPEAVSAEPTDPAVQDS